MYVLIVFVYVYGGVSATMHDFTSKQTCEAAKIAIMEKLRTMSVMCLPK